MPSVWYWYNNREAGTNSSLNMMYLCVNKYHCFEMLGWMKHKLESRLPGEISVTSDMQMTPPLWQKVKKN